MIISSATDYREAARRRLPPFLFHYLDGGAGGEATLRANAEDLQQVNLRQRVLKGSEQLDLSTEWFGTRQGLPLALAPVGLTGMYPAAARCRRPAWRLNAISRTSSPPFRSAHWRRWRSGRRSRYGASCTC